MTRNDRGLLFRVVTLVYQQVSHSLSFCLCCGRTQKYSTLHQTSAAGERKGEGIEKRGRPIESERERDRERETERNRERERKKHGKEGKVSAKLRKQPSVWEGLEQAVFFSQTLLSTAKQSDKIVIQSM